MKQAQVAAWGESPTVYDVPAPQFPPPDSDLVQIKVLAAGLHSLVRGRATGKHYSAKSLPHIPGTDGVGLTPEGKLVYFPSMTPHGGSFTELINVPRPATSPVPSGADPIQVAGLLNPVMASWMAYATRTTQLPDHFTAVILGATSLSGIAAVSVSRLFGAGRVVGVARNATKMAALGLDGTVELKDDVKSTDFSAALEADVILDFLYGPGALGLLSAVSPYKPVQYIQIGTAAGTTVEFPGDLLRSKDITMRGTGPGAWQMSQFIKQVPKIIEAIADGKIAKYRFQEVKLNDIQQAWSQPGADRMVIVP